MDNSIEDRLDSLRDKTEEMVAWINNHQTSEPTGGSGRYATSTPQIAYCQETRDNIYVFDISGNRLTTLTRYDGLINHTCTTVTIRYGNNIQVYDASGNRLKQLPNTF